MASSMSLQEWIKSLKSNEINLILKYHYEFIMPSAVVVVAPTLKPESKSLILEEGSAKKGLVGELNFEKIISQYAPHYRLTNRSKTGKSGDFILEDNSGFMTHRILVEIKNYSSRSVPHEEVEKFHRDLRTNVSIEAGIAISYHTKFTGFMDRAVNEEYFMSGEKRIPLLYLVGTDPEFIVRNIDWIFSRIRLQNQYDTVQHEIISASLQSIHEGTDNLSQIRNILDELRAYVGKQVCIADKYSLNLEHTINTAVVDISRHFNPHHVVYTNEIKESYNHMITNYKINTTVSKLLKILWDGIDKVIISAKESETKKSTSEKTQSSIFMFGKKSVTITLPNKKERIIHLKVTKAELFLKMNINDFVSFCNATVIATDKIRYDKGIYIEITSDNFNLVNDILLNY